MRFASSSPKDMLWHLRGVLRHGWRFLWHWAFKHPEDQWASPWCNCMGVFNVEDE